MGKVVKFSEYREYNKSFSEKVIDRIYEDIDWSPVPIKDYKSLRKNLFFTVGINEEGL